VHDGFTEACPALDAGAVESWLSGRRQAAAADFVEAVRVMPVSPKVNGPQ
jgi:hypothetical protein